MRVEIQADFSKSKITEHDRFGGMCGVSEPEGVGAAIRDQETGSS